jgi:hypothetical protein
VLTHDASGERLWWHMSCRDVMIPVLGGVESPLRRERAGEDA